MEDENVANVTEEDGVPVSNSMAAFSDSLEQLSQSLEILYITNNASGRRIFRDKWMEVADYLFGSELTTFDLYGAESEEQRTRRIGLEEEADMRRIDLKQTLSELVKKSVEAGSLQFDYVGGVVDKYGAGLSQYLYESSVIERVRPGVMAEFKKTKKEQEGDEIDSALEQVTSAESSIEPEVEQGQEAGQNQETEVSPSVVEEMKQSLEHAQEHEPEAPQLEQSENHEQIQDIAGTQQMSEPVQQQQRMQQTEPVNVSEEQSLQQIEPVAQSFDTPLTQQPQGETKNTEETKLSVEEVELLSNKKKIPVIPAQDAIQDIPTQHGQVQEGQAAQTESWANSNKEGLPPVSEDDPLDHVMPIETSVPESVVFEGEVVQDVSPELEPDKGAVASETNIDAMLEPVSLGEPHQEESFATQPQKDIEAKAQNVSEEGFQNLNVPDLADIHEAIAAQNIPAAEEMIAEGILQKEDLSNQAQQKQPEETMPEAKPEISEQEPADVLFPQEVSARGQEPVPTSEPALMSEDEVFSPDTALSQEASLQQAVPAMEPDPEVKGDVAKEEFSVFSLEEEVLREDLSQVLQSVPELEQKPESEKVSGSKATAELLERFVEPQIQQGAPSVEEKVETAQFAAGTVEVSVPQQQPEDALQAEEVVVPEPEQPEAVPSVEEQVASLQTQSGAPVTSTEPPPRFEPELDPEPKEIPIKLRPRGEKSGDSDIPNIMKYVSEQEEIELQNNQTVTKDRSEELKDENGDANQ